jgi:hypothetical protein
MNAITKLLGLGALLAVTGLIATSVTSAGAREEPANGIRVFNFVGTAKAQTCKIPRTDQGTTRTDLCFTAPLFEFRDGQLERVGTMTNTLADVREVGDGLALTGTSFFHLPEGELVSRGTTTVQPVTAGSPTVTHITGAIPRPGENNVLSGTGAFKDAAASVRISGAVNMSNFDNGEITFDCIFVVTFR